MAATKFSFFDISTSDRGDFPRNIEIALLFSLVYLYRQARRHQALGLYNTHIYNCRLCCSRWRWRDRCCGFLCIRSRPLGKPKIKIDRDRLKINNRYRYRSSYKGHQSQCVFKIDLASSLRIYRHFES